MAGSELASPPNLELHAGAGEQASPLVSISESICVFYAPPPSAKTVANTSSTVGNMGNEIFMMSMGGSAALYYHSSTSLVLTMIKNLLVKQGRH